MFCHLATVTTEMGLTSNSVWGKDWWVIKSKWLEFTRPEDNQKISCFRHSGREPCQYCLLVGGLTFSVIKPESFWSAAEDPALLQLLQYSLHFYISTSLLSFSYKGLALFSNIKEVTEHRMTSSAGCQVKWSKSLSIFIEIIFRYYNAFPSTLLMKYQI